MECLQRTVKVTIEETLAKGKNTLHRAVSLRQHDFLFFSRPFRKFVAVSVRILYLWRYYKLVLVCSLLGLTAVLPRNAVLRFPEHDTDVAKSIVSFIKKTLVRRKKSISVSCTEAVLYTDQWYRRHLCIVADGSRYKTGSIVVAGYS